METLKTNSAQSLKTIKVCEGARNNLPDEAAMNATQKMKQFAGTLTQEDVLFVLITGGGSALLPLPCDGISLDDKLEVIRNLVRKGATINELNVVRMKLSAIKGGQLAKAASGAQKVVSLIISDICNDPIELIASGPTLVDNLKKEQNALQILRKYGLWTTLPANVREAIARGDANNKEGESGGATAAAAAMENVFNVLIANNSLAVESCLSEINSLAGDTVRGVHLSNAIVGDVSQVSDGYARLAELVRKAMISGKEIEKAELVECLKKLSIEDRPGLINDLNEALLSGRDICFVAGGETTVALSGNGVGGRNQQMVMEFMKKCQERKIDGIYLLSAGTDGIDGPTDAAGAVGSLDILNGQFEKEEQERISKMIEANDSYNFFKSKPCHVITGHTGTNVMDIQLLLICK